MWYSVEQDLISMDQKVSDKISEPQHHPPLNAFTRSGCSVKFRHVTPSLKIIIYGDGREIGCRRDHVAAHYTSVK